MIFEYDLDLMEGSVAKGNEYVTYAADFPFRINGWAKFVTGANYYTRASEISQFLLTYTISGMGAIMKNGVIKPLTPGTAVLLGYSEQIQEYRRVSPEPWVMEWVRFDGANMDIYKTLLSEPITVVALQDANGFLQKLDSIPLFFSDSSLAARAREFAVVTGLLTDMICAIPDKDEEESENIAVRRKASIRELGDFIMLHPEQPLDLDECAAGIGMSKYTLIRQFAKLYGDAPYRYLMKNRIRKAEQILLNTNLPVGAIAEACGFCDAAALNHQFSKIKEMTPTEYRRKKLDFKLDDMSYLRT